MLLHVTLLPPRWTWGGAVNYLDSATKGLDACQPSEEMKTLRDSWRQLQDRVDDTVLERGILLPHPQNDYEVLEERLLEGLDLPVKRRARILECGHYLGPANETILARTSTWTARTSLAPRPAKPGQAPRNVTGAARAAVRSNTTSSAPARSSASRSTPATAL